VYTDSAEKEKASYFKNISFRPKKHKTPFLQTLKCKLADTADTHTQPEMKEERRELSFERERERERDTNYKLVGFNCFLCISSTSK
jgi:hypothetical protein